MGGWRECPMDEEHNLLLHPPKGVHLIGDPVGWTPGDHGLGSYRL
ncbi:MAG: hypothetical protein QXO76_03230 [Thermoproteota archaeon]